MALYVSTTVGTKIEDIKLRKNLLEETLRDYPYKGMEIWFRGKDPESSVEIKQKLESVLGKNYSDKYFLTVQARRTDPEGNKDMFDPANYYDLRTDRGIENLLINATTAKNIGARAVVVASSAGVFRYPEGYQEKFEDHHYRSEQIYLAIDNARKVSREAKIKIAIEHPTVPLYADFNPNIDGSMFDLGLGLFEHTVQIPGGMLVMDTCHIESARNITRRIKSKELSFVPGVMNSLPQPNILAQIQIATPFEIHYAGFKGDWDPHATPPSTHLEGTVPGGEDDEIGGDIFIALTHRLKKRARMEDVVIVAEPNDKDFMNPVNAETTLKKIINWINH